MSMSSTLLSPRFWNQFENQFPPFSSCHKPAHLMLLQKMRKRQRQRETQRERERECWESKSVFFKVALPAIESVKAKNWLVLQFFGSEKRRKRQKKLLRKYLRKKLLFFKINVTINIFVDYIFYRLEVLANSLYFEQMK